MKKSMLIVVALLSLSACVRARLPDGKLYTCVRHTAPVPDHGGPVRTFWSGSDQYSCVGPHDGTGPYAVTADEINGQKRPVPLAAR